MSDELTVIEGLAERAPKELEHNLVQAMRGIARRITERADVLRACHAAQQLQEGYTVTTPEAAAELADLVAIVIDGDRVLDEQIRMAVRIPKAMEAAVRQVAAPVRFELDRAIKVGSKARVQYQNTERQRAAQEEERQKREAAEQAARAAAEAEETGGDVPPEPEVASIEVPRTVVGGVGKMGLQVRIEPIGVADFSAAPREWFKLDTATARAAFQAAERSKQVEKPPPGESIVWKGVRFEARESAVNRR